MTSATNTKQPYQALAQPESSRSVGKALHTDRALRSLLLVSNAEM